MLLCYFEKYHTIIVDSRTRCAMLFARRLIAAREAQRVEPDPPHLSGTRPNPC